MNVAYTKEQRAFVVNERSKGISREEIAELFTLEYGLKIGYDTITRFCKNTPYAMQPKDKVFTPEMVEYIKENYDGTPSYKSIAAHLSIMCGKPITTTQLANKIGYLGLNFNRSMASACENGREEDYKIYLAKINALKSQIKIGSKVRVKRERWDGDIGFTKVKATVKGIYPHFINVVYKNRDILVSYAWDNILAVVKG